MKNTTPSTLADGLERLERAIAHQGLASRREAKDLIRSGSVRVNDKIIKEPGFGVNMDTDTITIDGDMIAAKTSVAIYKPRGIETSATNTGSKDIHSQFPHYKHLSPIGRLDKESEGLIILSNDGTLTHALTKIDSHVYKTYEVSTREPISDSALRKMADGIMLDDTPTKPAKTKRSSRTSFTIMLNEGRKHQIRRMCDACHLTITSLKRTHIGSISIGKMRAGNSRKLTEDEVAGLKR